MLGVMNVSNCLLIFLKLIFIRNLDMELGNNWLFSIGNWAVIRPLEKGRKSLQKYCNRQDQSDQGLYRFMYNSFLHFSSYHINFEILYI